VALPSDSASSVGPATLVPGSEDSFVDFVAPLVDSVTSFADSVASLADFVT